MEKKELINKAIQMKGLTIERVIIVLLIALVVFMRVKSCTAPEKQADKVAAVQAIKDAPVVHNTDAGGRDHGGKQVAEADLATIKSVYEAEISRLKRDNKELKSENQILSFSITGTETSDTVVPDVVRIGVGDTANYSFTWGDKWVNVGGIVGPTQKTLFYSYRDSLSTTFYWKRKIPVIGRKVTYMDAYSLNPKTKITGMTGVQINDLGYDKFNLDVYAGFQTNFAQQRLAAGLSGQYHFTKRLSFEGAYQFEYDGAANDRVLVLRLRETLFKF